MKRILSAVALVLVLPVIGCGTSPQQACKDIVATTCKQMFTCYTATEVEVIKAIFGATETECTTKLTASANCEKTEPCATGKTYDTAAAATCVSDWKALTCDKVKAGTTPTSCSALCK